MAYEDGQPDRLRFHVWHLWSLNERRNSHTTVSLEGGHCQETKTLGYIESYLQMDGEKIRRLWVVKVTTTPGRWTTRWLRYPRRVKPQEFRSKADAVQAIVDYHNLPRGIPR